MTLDNLRGLASRTRLRAYRGKTYLYASLSASEFPKSASRTWEDRRLWLDRVFPAEKLEPLPGRLSERAFQEDIGSVTIP